MITTRRSFITQAATAAGVSAILPSRAFAANARSSPGGRITVGGIGLGPRGREVLKCFLQQPDVQFVAVDLARSGKLGKLHTLHAGIWLP